MKIENNNNLPVVRKNHFTRQFKDKIKQIILLSISLLGSAIPYLEDVAVQDIPKNIDNNHRATINEIADEDIDLKYENAFNELGVKISQATENGISDEAKRDKSETKTHIDDEPPDDKKGKDLIKKPTDKTHRHDHSGDELMKFYNNLKSNVNSDVRQYKEFKNKHIRSNLRDEI